MGRASKRKKARRLAGHAAGQARTLRCAAGPPTGNPLETLVHVGGVPQHEVLRVGLVVLSTLADLCGSDSASILRPAA